MYVCISHVGVFCVRLQAPQLDNLDVTANERLHCVCVFKLKAQSSYLAFKKKVLELEGGQGTKKNWFKLQDKRQLNFHAYAAFLSYRAWIRLWKMRFSVGSCMYFISSECSSWRKSSLGSLILLPGSFFVSHYALNQTTFHSTQRQLDEKQQ